MPNAERITRPIEYKPESIVNHVISVVVQVKSLGNVTWLATCERCGHEMRGAVSAAEAAYAARHNITTDLIVIDTPPGDSVPQSLSLKPMHEVLAEHALAGC